ncbi:hypothetical protein M9H77_23427 [Catharanthus roseus]|uniref:Uncharacterized protein n=1 Tax=Catharanthus roseus TaxID=4058 RepID=A0ACC0AT83_CATRO|nr:hypothetical protein M9H77_23427 [Catharanthus roseus]
MMRCPRRPIGPHPPRSMPLFKWIRSPESESFTPSEDALIQGTSPGTVQSSNASEHKIIIKIDTLVGIGFFIDGTSRVIDDWRTYDEIGFHNLQNNKGNNDISVKEVMNMKFDSVDQEDMIWCDLNHWLEEDRKKNIVEDDANSPVAYFVSKQDVDPRGEALYASPSTRIHAKNSSASDRDASPFYVLKTVHN